MLTNSRALTAAAAAALAVGAWMLVGAGAQDREADLLEREVLYNSLQREMLPHLAAGAVVDVSAARDDGGAYTRCHISYQIDLDDPRAASARRGFEKALRAAAIDPAKLNDLPLVPKKLASVVAKATWWPFIDEEAQKRYRRLSSDLGLQAGPLRVDGGLNVRYRGQWRAFMRSGGTWHGVAH